MALAIHIFGPLNSGSHCNGDVASLGSFHLILSLFLFPLILFGSNLMIDLCITAMTSIRQGMGYGDGVFPGCGFFVFFIILDAPSRIHSVI